MIRLVSVLMLLICEISYSQTTSMSLIGKTTGPLPFLMYGLGEDRLGGAKMTSLDSDVVVNVIDSIKDEYKVKLSANHSAWLPKENFKRDTSVKLSPYYLTNSWKVYGDDKYDYVNIKLQQRLPYRSVQQINPARIVVDIFGAVSNTNWITQLKTAKEIKNGWYEQVEDDVFRVTLELKHQQHWGYFISYKDSMLVIRVKQQPKNLSIKNLLIAIDAGHGGSNAGAGGIRSGVNEKDYTLKIAKELEKYLKLQKVKVFMTRNNDTDLTMIDRTLMLREAQPDLLISIHLNSADNTSVSGTSTYYRYIGFRSLSQAVLKRMEELGLNEYGNVGSFNFSLNGPTEYPNCLVEVAFLSNVSDEKKILNATFRKQVAQKIYLGITDWLKQISLQH
jgi:N-acetylmuramoyl-L-alanine amidase